MARNHSGVNLPTIQKNPRKFHAFFLTEKMSAARKQVPFGPRKAMGAGRGDGTQQKIGTKNLLVKMSLEHKTN